MCDVRSSRVHSRIHGEASIVTVLGLVGGAPGGAGLPWGPSIVPGWRRHVSGRAKRAHRAPGAVWQRLGPVLGHFCENFCDGNFGLLASSGFSADGTLARYFG